MNLRSIRFRIVAPVVAAMVFMGAAMAFLLVQFQEGARTEVMVTEGYLPLASVVTRLEQHQQRVDTDISRLLADAPRPGTGATAPAAIYVQALQEDLAVARLRVQVARQVSRTGEDRAALNRVSRQLEVIDQVFADYQDHASQFVARSEAGDLSGARQIEDPVRTDGRRLAQELATLRQLIDGRIQRIRQQRETARVRGSAIAAAVTLLGFVLVMGSVGAVLYALRPISELTDQVQRLAGGDYSGRVLVGGSDEIGALAEEFNAMAHALEVRDRTLVERAEELNRLSRYLASVLDSLEDALLVVEDGVTTLANPAAKRIFGARDEAPPPESLRGLSPGRHELKTAQALHEIRVIPFGSGVVVTAEDVTEKNRAKGRLARSERLALVGQMLAQITHEVRNPLNALSLNAELLTDELLALDEGKKSEAWDLLEVVSAEIERLTAVTAHYLQLARRRPAELGPTDLRELSAGVSRLLDAELNQDGVSLTLEADDPGLQMVDGDQIRQALLNVVRNAVEAGATELVLRLNATDTEVFLALVDNGPGMTGDEIRRAFEPFYSSKAKGTGLGLAITRQILEDHDGTVRVDSAPDRGTTVTLALPRRPVPTVLSDEAHP